MDHYISASIWKFTANTVKAQNQKPWWNKNKTQCLKLVWILSGYCRTRHTPHRKRKTVILGLPSVNFVQGRSLESGFQSLYPVRYQTNDISWCIFKVAFQIVAIDSWVANDKRIVHITSVYLWAQNYLCKKYKFRCLWACNCVLRVPSVFVLDWGLVTLPRLVTEDQSTQWKARSIYFRP